MKIIAIDGFMSNAFRLHIAKVAAAAALTTTQQQQRWQLRWRRRQQQRQRERQQQKIALLHTRIGCVNRALHIFRSSVFHATVPWCFVVWWQSSAHTSYGDWKQQGIYKGKRETKTESERKYTKNQMKKKKTNSHYEEPALAIDLLVITANA